MHRTTWLLALTALGAATPEVERARQLFESASYKAAVDLLTPVAKSGNDAEASLWLGKSLLMTGEHKRASETLERAVALQPGDSESHHWLGRAYGRRAETANVLMAPGLASKTRQSFEKAVSLNPRNLPAMVDLLEYYLEAPGFLGGGLDKAHALTEKIKRQSRVRYHYGLARIAEKDKDLARAEENYKRSVALAPQSAPPLLDLGRFLAKQGRYAESEAAFAQAAKLDSKLPRILYERANAYVRAKTNSDTAKQLLQRYIKMPLGPDDPPVEDAKKLLKQVS